VCEFGTNIVHACENTEIFHMANDTTKYHLDNQMPVSTKTENYFRKIV